MYIKWPDSEEIRKVIARDGLYWRNVYKQQRSICPETKRAPERKVCCTCNFQIRVKDQQVFCALAGGWLSLETSD